MLSLAYFLQCTICLAIPLQHICLGCSQQLSQWDWEHWGSFLGVLSQKKGSCIVPLSFVAFLWSLREAEHMHWVINMSSFCFHRVLNGRSPVKSVWSQQEVAFKTGSWTCSQFCIDSFLSHLTLLHFLYLIFSCLSAIGQKFLTNQVFTISEVLLEKT